jgi:microcystin-dependent protein
MATAYVAEIRIFGFNFAPVGWAMCNGQILPISQNTALFSLLGTTYGGDGKSNFRLPNLQGIVALQQGQGTGLSPYFLGEETGSTTETLQLTELPGHVHTVNADSGKGNSTSPGGNLYKEGEIPGSPALGVESYNNSLQPHVSLNPLTIGFSGGGQPHNNVMPTLVLNYCICMQGVYPPRT